MAKGNGGTRRGSAGNATGVGGGLAVPNRYESEQQAEKTLSYNRIHTSNIFNVEDIYSAQDKIIAVVKTNEYLREALQNNDISVGGLSISPDGQLEVSHINAVWERGKNPMSTKYINLRVDERKGFIEATMHGFVGGDIKWRTERLDNIKEQADYMVRMRWDSKKNYDRRMEEIVDPDTTGHTLNKASRDTKILHDAIGTVNGHSWWRGRPKYLQ